MGGSIGMNAQTEALSEKDLLSVEAQVVNARNDSGKIGFALYQEENFMKQPIQSGYAKIENGKAIFNFEELKPGTYAIMVFHDENDNNRMDFEPNGMPKEDYGMSNNVMAMGPPTFDQAKFDLFNQNLELKIKF